MLLIFGICSLFWATRFARRSDINLPEIFNVWVQHDCSVWLEHFVAALGIPSLFASFGFYAAAFPTKRNYANQPLANWLGVFFCGGLGMFFYCVAEFSHEVMQLTLAKESNFGQFLADNCIPASKIEHFGQCSQQYFPILTAQLMADAAGLFVFLSVFLWHAYLAGENHVSFTDS